MTSNWKHCRVHLTSRVILVLLILMPISVKIGKEIYFKHPVTWIMDSYMAFHRVFAVFRRNMSLLWYCWLVEDWIYQMFWWEILIFRQLLALTVFYWLFCFLTVFKWVIAGSLLIFGWNAILGSTFFLKGKEKRSKWSDNP